MSTGSAQDTTTTPKFTDDVGRPLLLRAAQAAETCGTSVRTWRAWDVAGKIPQPIRIGRVPFWLYKEFQAWAAAGCPDRVTWEALRG